MEELVNLFHGFAVALQPFNIMSKHHIRHVPVIDNYSLIGVVSIRDITTAFDDEATPLKLAASA